MDDQQLLRYSRHLLLDAWGMEGQNRVHAAKALVVGAGGLGSPAALYLASAGVGHLTIADGDTVDLTNLQRQILHTTQRLGQAKALSAQLTLQAMNPDITIVPIASRLEGVQLEGVVEAADVVLDCSDNFATRHALNRACVQFRKPLVSGAAIAFSGQATVFDLRQNDAPCYHCLFPEGEDLEETRCAVMGVFAPLTGQIGSLQAAEALKLIAGIGETLAGRLLLLDGLRQRWRTIGVQRDPACTVCADR